MYNEIYTFLCWLFFLLAVPLYLLYSQVTGQKIAGIRQRLGFFPCDDVTGSHSRIWFHAASVGEVKVVKALIPWVDRFIPNARFIITTVTEQGHIIALEQLATYNTICLYAPVDLPWVVRRFIRLIRPTAYICLETELWPNMIKIAANSGIKMLLLNGRISENSFKNYQKVRPLVQNTLGKFLHISAIMPHDKDRFVALGAKEIDVTVNGNAKYDTLPYGTNQTKNKDHPECDQHSALEIIDHCRLKLSIAPNQPVLIAGSTHSGEEEIILAVYERLKNEINDLVLIVAPRHIRRVQEISNLLKKNNVFHCLYDALSPGKRSSDIILLDSMGDLAVLYSIGTYVFCGGSLVPKGGHNLMEPALWGIPPLYGSYTSDFHDAKNMLEAGNASFPVNSADELYEKIIGFHRQPGEYQQAGIQAKKIALAQQGSAKRQALLIQKVLLTKG